jgi:hypothetical protein
VERRVIILVLSRAVRCTAVSIYVVAVVAPFAAVEIIVSAKVADVAIRPGARGEVDDRVIEHE